MLKRMIGMKRLFTEEELKAQFGGRNLFASMNQEQRDHVNGYLMRKYNASCTVEGDDYEVYKHLRKQCGAL
jgi:hypothetical protein